LEEKKHKRKRKLFDFTPEEKEEIRQRSLKARAALTLAYQLGFYVGEEIVHRYLPTLSVDMIRTNKNISVTCAEGDECRRLNNVWYAKRMASRDDDNKSSEKEWNELRAYHEMLEEKYLPKTVRCSFQLLNITEEHMEEFKKGVGDSLWDCDCSHYSTRPEDIEVKADEDGWFTEIILKRD
jgi:hypothetical protein